MVKLLHASKIKTILCITLIISILMMVNGGLAEGTVNSYNYVPNVKVQMKDIRSLGEYAENHYEEFFIVEDDRVTEKIINDISNDSEAVSFSGMDKKLTRESYKGSFFSGEIQKRYKVYTVGFESIDSNGNGWFVMIIYDTDRKLLIDAYRLTIANNEHVEVIHRNSGTKVNSTVKELIELQNSKNRGLQETTISKLYSSETEMENKLNNDNDSYSSSSSKQECEWSSIVACTLSGVAFGLVGGLVCSVATKLVCDNCACN
ncbi:hypothetical protein M3650_14820 [Paenibacillus sp. MER TA 81-3]|uniref:hypothetical protein n=1 Tax=Paenibacillus sp. MER TA 81-3 TaxID=2939573 RepID=UPI00203FC02D|nr:hypothetical protein [Paenibacillus sp. MER TA 81-3]MCM3339866.1 hypothetical protein [Paenibacillus sp. MER TA 81-3]